MEFGIFNGAYVPASMVEAEGPGAAQRRQLERVRRRKCVGTLAAGAGGRDRGTQLLERVV